MISENIRHGGHIYVRMHVDDKIPDCSEVMHSRITRVFLDHCSVPSWNMDASVPQFSFDDIMYRIATPFLCDIFLGTSVSPSSAFRLQT